MPTLLQFTRPVGALDRHEVTRIPIARIVEIVPVPATMPVHAEGARTMMTCKGGDVYFAEEDATEIAARIDPPEPGMPDILNHYASKEDG